MNRRRFLRSTVAAAVASAISTNQALSDVAYHALTEVVADVSAVTGDGARITLERAAVQELSASLAGPLLLPGNPGYEEARHVLNGSIDKHPALIVQPTGSADVSTAVRFARERELLLAVKGGGHSVSGRATCDDGMMIDLSLLRGVRVDPAARTAQVAGGCLLGHMDHETMAHGLVTTAGTVSHTGVGGLTLGGGFGRVGRRFGLAIDNLKSADVVTADGQLRFASEDSEPDLFWGVRGSGGNFGVVTSFEFRLHPMQREVITGSLMFPFAQARDVLSFYGDYTPDAPDEMYVDAMMVSPPGSSDGMIMLSVVYSGPAENAERLIAPLRKAGKVIVDSIKTMDYVALQRSGDQDDPRAMGAYQKSGFTTEIGGDFIDNMVNGFSAVPERLNLLFFQHSAGAINRVPSDAMAFPHRYATHNMFTSVAWPMPGDPQPHVDWIRDYWATLEPSTYGFYVNELVDESQRTVSANYQGNYERLVQVKNQYDPSNLFRLNANVPPSV